jgi:hypothetical protein
MTTAKRNRSVKKVGLGRGVPVRLARGIAKKYSLSHIVILTADQQERSRILYWARNDLGAMQCASFCGKAEKELGWESVWNWDCSSVRRLKDRIKDLERNMALIFEREGDPIAIARLALKLPIDV